MSVVIEVAVTITNSAGDILRGIVFIDPMKANSERVCWEAVQEAHRQATAQALKSWTHLDTALNRRLRDEYFK